MNASDFSSSRLFARLFSQAEPIAALDLLASDPLAPSPLTTSKSGLGSSWEEKTIEQNAVNLAASSTATVIDPLGLSTESLGQPAHTQAASSIPYPGYVLRYSPGFPLKYRPAVAQWQQQMRDRGWTIAVDGFYGAQSERVAEQFQAEKGLVVDGVVGAQTWRAAFDNSTITGVSDTPGDTPTDIPSDTSIDTDPVVDLFPGKPDSNPSVSNAYPGNTLSYRPFQPLSFDPQAQAFQQRLKDLGWRIEADGLFGARSDAATRLIQQQNNLTVDGIVGPLTWAAVFDEQAPLAPTEQTLNPVVASSRINAAGLELIKSFEGLRLNSYRDAVGVWTIGYGHTRTAGPGQSISYAQANNLLRGDIATFEKAVTESVRVPITDNQFAALVSFAYNVGSGALRSSTLLRRLNAGDTYGAANEFLRWNRAGGRVLYGLTRRREAERALFLS